MGVATNGSETAYSVLSDVMKNIFIQNNLFIIKHFINHFIRLFFQFSWFAPQRLIDDVHVRCIQECGIVLSVKI